MHDSTRSCRSIAVLHDRRIPGSKANIDHIAITAAGIWVIDAKRYKGDVYAGHSLAEGRPRDAAG